MACSRASSSSSARRCSVTSRAIVTKQLSPRSLSVETATSMIRSVPSFARTRSVLLAPPPLANSSAIKERRISAPRMPSSTAERPTSASRSYPSSFSNAGFASRTCPVPAAVMTIASGDACTIAVQRASASDVTSARGVVALPDAGSSALRRLVVSATVTITALVASRAVQVMHKSAVRPRGKATWSSRSRRSTRPVRMTARSSRSAACSSETTRSVSGRPWRETTGTPRIAPSRAFARTIVPSSPASSAIPNGERSKRAR